jgi:dienelactone hydrolase
MTQGVLPGTLTHSVHIPADGVTLSGELVIPAGAAAIVVFAHGSGRVDPRNQHVAQALQAAGMATLLVDLLTPPEASVDAETEQLRFDIGFLAERLVGVIDWLVGQQATHGLMIGLFGAGTDTAAALEASAARNDLVRAIVSRGGRPDLAETFLAYVHAPTLLIVGERDTLAISQNRAALNQLTCRRKLALVVGAGHLFIEPGTLDEVARLATDWFSRRFVRDARPVNETVAVTVDDVC